MNDANELDDLKRSAPTLFGLPKKHPFVVPQGFFDRFPHEVQGLVTARRRNAVGIAWKRAAIALPVIALLGSALWWATRTLQGPVPVATTSEVALTDGELDQLEDEELLALTEDIIPLADDPGALGKVDIQLNDEELLAYFESNGADINELITTE